MLRGRAKKQGARRSPHWSSTRKAHLQYEPVCQMCGGTEKLEVHHIHPFHVHPERELDQSNLITLCEKPSRDCHFRFGHFFNWKWWNTAVRDDAASFLARYQDAKKEFE